jgi:hypothetical protein
MFHHLGAEERLPRLREARRVLKAGGEFHMLDFEGPDHGMHGFLARIFHASERLKDNSETRAIALMDKPGFSGAKKVGSRKMLFGEIAYYRATA